MAVSKLSQIAAAPSPPPLTDKIVGVSGGITDYQYTLQDIQTAVAAGPIVINVAASPWIGMVSGGDWTAALNAASAYILAHGAIGTIILPGTSITISDTWKIGDTAGTGPGTGTAVTINIDGGPSQALINYVGPLDGRPAIWVAKNKRFVFRNLFVNQATAANPGASIGMILGGSVNTDTATQCTGALLLMCGFSNFQYGITDNDGAASELTFEEVWFLNTSGGAGIGYNTVGARFDAFNSTNHTYINCQFSSLDTGINTGGASLVNVYGAGCQLNGIDFYCDLRARMIIDGVRNEDIPNNGMCIKGNAGQVVARNIRVNSVSAGGNHGVIGGTFRQFSLENSAIEGYIIFDSFDNIRSLNIIDTYLWPIPGSKLPFKAAAVGVSLRCHVICKNNWNTFGDVYDDTPTASRFALPDFEGQIWTDQFGTVYVDPKIWIQKIGTADDLNAGNPDLDSVESMGLHRVRCLSEAGMPGMADALGVNPPQPGQNLRVQGKFATSNSLAITFQRSVSVTSDGGFGGIILGTGTYFQADNGKRIFISGGGNPSGDFHGTIVGFNSTTNAFCLPADDRGFANFSGAKTALIGTPEPNSAYMVLVTGNANETFWVDTITAAGFTVHSSNATSTATVTCLIIR